MVTLKRVLGTFIDGTQKYRLTGGVIGTHEEAIQEAITKINRDIGSLMVQRAHFEKMLEEHRAEKS